jgi:YVTN family beta-propeller protein
MNMRHAIVLLTLVVFGCQKEDPTAPVQENPVGTKGIYILNEGGYTKSNASLSLYVPDSNKVYPDVFFAANGKGLGDVANDMVIYGTKAFIVVNNSHKVEVISTVNHTLLGTINVPGNSPNRIVIVSESKGYISNLYKGTVTAFNPTTLGIIKDNIAVGQNPQGMVYANGKVFVCNSGYGADSTVSVIDPMKDSVVATIVVAASPTDIGIDSDGEVLVLSNGYSNFAVPSKDTPGAVSVINASSNSVTASIPFPLAAHGHPFEFAISSKGYAYTITDAGIVKFDTRNNTVSPTAVVPKGGYAVAVDDATERIYRADAKNFSGSGIVYVYDKTGAVKDSIVTGIGPNNILFKR